MDLSDNYHLRKCFFKRNQVPTQSTIKKYMSPPLANVYFKSMSYKLKVLAGIEPPMKGGGDNWYIPPKELLKGRIAMQPIQRKHLSKLNYLGVDEYGMKFIQIHRDRMNTDRDRMLATWDNNCKRRVEQQCRQQWLDCTAEAARENTSIIKNAFHQFSMLYTTSTTQIQDKMLHAAIEKIKKYREFTFLTQSSKYEMFVRQQAGMLYDRYTDKLNKEKNRLKETFLDNLNTNRAAWGRQLHDINVEKHAAIEKLRKYLECQNLACQVYVALKERDVCTKDIDLSERRHKKKITTLTDTLTIKDLKIECAIEKERKREEFNTIWLKKVCHVVKKFQLFVSYCLKALPEHADFFINMEKLMLLQLNETLDNPEAESIFETDVDWYQPSPVPEPHPYYLFCDKVNKRKVDRDLCPKHCTSSGSQIPAIVVNKHCIYSACDNFQLFGDKLTSDMSILRDDADLEDDFNYDFAVPVKSTASQQLRELKLESSLLQVLQKELDNTGRGVDCPGCNMGPSCPCFFLCSEKLKSKPQEQSVMTEKPAAPISRGKTLTRATELLHERQPKAESYLKYVESKKCACAKMAKKHLEAHLPPYMRQTSTYEAPELLSYEPCSLITLKSLVKRARGIKAPPPPPAKVPSRTKDVGIQVADGEFDILCTCFSNESVFLFASGINTMTTDNWFKVVDSSVSTSYLSKDSKSFAEDRAKSLLNLVEHTPAIVEIFKKNECTF
ncbi:uncharacterized protein LOC142980197 [Anticarsia gemmatalis]|uniref:uncharacterized protein LOC142980197 n=1 Tax=Anticarsia gemmatalis TaxID=129554 RepID=UPI003F763DAB